jgi:hypothetical protein
LNSQAHKTPNELLKYHKTNKMIDIRYESDYLVILKRQKMTIPKVKTFSKFYSKTVETYSDGNALKIGPLTSANIRRINVKLTDSGS